MHGIAYGRGGFKGEHVGHDSPLKPGVPQAYQEHYRPSKSTTGLPGAPQVCHEHHGLSGALFYKFCANLLNEGINEDRATARQSLLRWPCPLPSDRAIPVLWQNLESNV